jgi:vesicle coat complex subunit
MTETTQPKNRDDKKNNITHKNDTKNLIEPTHQEWRDLQVLNSQIRSATTKLSQTTSFIEGAELLYNLFDTSVCARKTWNNLYHAVLTAGSL